MNPTSLWFIGPGFLNQVPTLRAWNLGFIRVWGFRESTLLGGSWVVISGVISRVSILITLIRGHITPLLTTPEPPSMYKQRSLNAEPLTPSPAELANGWRSWRSGPAKEAGRCGYERLGRLSAWGLMRSV